MIGVLFLTADFPAPFGGSEKQLYELLRRLDRSRFAPHLLCLSPGGRVPGVPDPCPTALLHVPRLRAPNALSSVLPFASYCRHHRIDVVHTLFPDAYILGTLWARACGIGVVVASRRNVGYWHTPRDVRVMRALRPLTTHYVANSRAAANACIATEGIAAERVTVIPNGMDAGAFAPPAAEVCEEIRRSWGFAREHFVVGAVANLSPIKGHDLFVAAADRFLREQPAARFVVLGEGPHRPVLEAEIRTRGLTGAFVLPGRSQRVAEALHAMDVCVLTSHSESLSNAVMECMAAGRPTVSSDVGGARELIDDGSSGLLFRAGDAEAFLRHLRALAQDPARRAALGAAARAAVLGRFDWPVIMPQHEALYERLVARARVRWGRGRDGAPAGPARGGVPSGSGVAIPGGGH